MKNLKEYIESGVMEMYLLGLASIEESAELEQLAQLHPEISAEIEGISGSLLSMGSGAAKNPQLNAKIKPFLMAIIDYTERLKNGELPAYPPVLGETSSAADFSAWLNRKDICFDGSFGDTYAKIIGYSPEVMTAVVWLKYGSPFEVHEKEVEKFLILEGSCNIVTADKVFALSPGNYFQIPLHMGHTVEVTSEMPCKLILQRLAA